MIYALSGGGGVISMGDRKLSVRGRTLRDMAEFEAYWLSLCGSPVDYIREIVRTSEAFRDNAFVDNMLRTIRVAWLSGCDDAKLRLSMNPEGKEYSLWQSVRHNSKEISLDWVSAAVERECDDRGQLEFWKEVDLLLGIGNGKDELGSLWLMHQSHPAGPGASHQSLTSTIVSLTREPFKLPLNDILDMTPQMVKILTMRTEDLNINVEMESSAPAELDDPVIKAYRHVHKSAAESLLAGRRWDS